MTLHHVIVGGGIAGLSAAEAIRRGDSRARITMVSPEPTPFYSRPGLAYALTNEVPERQLAIRSREEEAALRIERIAQPALRLIPDAHQLVLEGGRQLSYDRLLIAVGAASLPASFPGATLDGVVHLDGMHDAHDIIRRCATAHAAVVIGGGSTALELVDGLRARGLDTHYLMRGDRYWSRVFDDVESAIVEARLRAEGVTLHRLCHVREAVGTAGRLTSVLTSKGDQLPCDILAVAIGVQPRLALAESAGLHTDRGILTNEYLETSAPDVYAAGDVAQILDPVTKRAQLDTLWTSALAQGRSAGLNMGGLRIAHRKRAPINVTRVGGITVTIIGSVGSSDDPDLLTITRGQSERWITDPHAWTIAGAHRGDRLRVVVSGRAIVGAVVMGNQHVSSAIAHLVDEGVDISSLRSSLEAHPDDAMALLLAFCEHHVTDRTAHNN